MNTYKRVVKDSLKTLQSSKKVWAFMTIGLLMISSPVFAEAPVYDADAMPPQYEAEPPSNEQADFPMSMADQGDTFVPMRPQNTRPAETAQSAQASAPTPTPAYAPGPTEGLNMDERLKRIEVQINNMQSNEAVARTDSLQTQVQSLREQVDQLTHQLQQLQEQQKGMLASIEQKLAQAATKAPPPAAPPSEANAGKPKVAAQKPAVLKLFGKSESETNADKSAAQQPNVAEEQQIYQTAYTLIKNKKYNEAVTVLKNMLQKYPSGQFASNAHYWLGELYGLLGNNDQALNEFDTVIKNYPESPRISDAQLKVGLIYAAEFKWPEAKLAFKRVINHYPGTTSSRLAQEQLKQIKQAGH